MNKPFEPGLPVDDPRCEHCLMLSRRQFFGLASAGIGGAALSSLLEPAVFAADGKGALGQPHFPPRVKRVIYLFQAGGPAQLDLFDYKPRLRGWHGDELPDSVRGSQRVTGMTADQASFPVTASRFDFAQHGQSGAWVSELLPHTAKKFWKYS